MSLTSWEITRQAKHFRHARYLRDTCFPLVPNWYWPVRNYVEIPICPITHLHTIIQYQYSGFEDTYHTIGKNPIDIDVHLPFPIGFSDLHREADEYSYRASTPGRLPRPDSVFILRGGVEGFWSVPAIYRVHRWKAYTNIRANCLLSFLFPVPESLLLTTHGRVQQAHMHSWVGLKHPPPFHDQPISQPWAPHTSLCHLKTWDAYLGNDHYPKYAA